MQQQAAEFFLTSESVYFEPTFSRPARTRAVPETPSEARPSPAEEVRPKKRKTSAAVKDGLSESARAVAPSSAPTSAPASARESAPASVPASPASLAAHAGVSVAKACGTSHGIPRGIPRAATAAGTTKVSQAQSAAEAKPVPPKLTPAPFFAIARDHSLARAKGGTKA